MCLGSILRFLKVFQRIIEDVLVAVTAASEASQEGASLYEALELCFDYVEYGIVSVLEIDILLVSFTLNFQNNLAKVASLIRQTSLILNSFFNTLIRLHFTLLLLQLIIGFIRLLCIIIKCRCTMTTIGTIDHLCLLRTLLLITPLATFTCPGFIYRHVHSISSSDTRALRAGGIILSARIQGAVGSACCRLLDVLLVDLASNLSNLLLV